MPTSPEAALEAFLVDALSISEIQRLLVGTYQDAARAALPSEDQSLAGYVHEVVELCRSKRWLHDRELFLALAQTLHRRRAEVEQHAQAFGHRLGAGPPRGVRPPPSEVEFADHAIPPLREGRFKSIEILGRGSYAIVYKAWDYQMGDWRALKVLRREWFLADERSALDRFRREASVLSDARHDRVVPILDVFEEPHMVVIVMPWVRGGSLAQRVKDQGPMAADQAVAIMQEVLAALAFVHARGVVHRDVRPDNILLDEGGHALLCDFGVARLLDLDTLHSRHTRAIGGALGFLAPEQRLDPDAVDARTDLYCVGVTLVALVRGDLRGGDPSHPTEAERLLASLPVRLRRVVKQACAYNQADRFQSAPDFQQALRAPEVQPGSAPGDRLVLTLPGGVELPLAWIPLGTFWMGSPEGVGSQVEHPRHQVTLTRGYWLGVTPVTQAQWKALATGELAKRHPYFPGSDRPMESVSWFDAVRWCNALSDHLGLPLAYRIGSGEQPEVEMVGEGFRLPTEAEWERACRAGTDTTFSFGDDEAKLAGHGWFGRNGGKGTHPVGQLLPNPWGLHDLHGNVWEWCGDGWRRTYTDQAVRDPWEPPRGVVRVVRGGSWWDSAVRLGGAGQAPGRQPGLPRAAARPRPRLRVGR